MHNKVKTKKLLVSLMGIGIIWFGVRYTHDKFVVDQMLKRYSYHGQLTAGTEDESWQWTAFWNLWSEREKRDIGPELAPMLTSTSWEVRRDSLRACMILESPACEAPLSQIVAHPPTQATENFPGLSPVEYQLALGRIQARDKKGEAKIRAALRPTGLAWRNVVAISKKVNTVTGYLHYSGSDGEKVVFCMVDTIHDMQRRGENLEYLWRPLLLKKPQIVMLEGSLLSVEAEADLIINYCLKAKAVNYHVEKLINAFPSLGKPAVGRLYAKLQDMASHPDKYPDTKQGAGHYALFKLVVACNDKRFIPLLKKFEKSPNDYIVSYAYEQRLLLQANRPTGWRDPL